MRTDARTIRRAERTGPGRVWGGFLIGLPGPILLALCLSLLPFSAHSALPVRSYDLTVSVDTSAAAVEGVARIEVAAGEPLKIHRGTLAIAALRVNGTEIPVSPEGETITIHPSVSGTVEVTYKGQFRSTGGEETDSAIVENGLFLTGTWYPKPEGLWIYNLTASVPDGFEAISEAESIKKVTRDGRSVFSFTFPHPLTGINLIAANRYVVAKEEFDGIEIVCYFFDEDKDLIPLYLEKAKRYFLLYKDMVGAIPYKRFSIVENFLPTGYSMPTYTVLGQQVLRLPFIPDTSLGHEILHQWLGNLVFIDYGKGNWAEGLTTFLADHFYEEKKGRGWAYRKAAISNYLSYVNGDNEFSLRDFRERTDRGSQAIGYGKAVMVFQMLRDLVGQERFTASLKEFVATMRFKQASWEDIEKAFEKTCGMDLKWFFTEWIDRKGLADIRIANAKVTPSGEKFALSFEVSQGKEPFTVDLPVTVDAREKKERQVFRVSKEREALQIVTDRRPERVVVDEDYQVARKLSSAEFSPAITRLLGDKNLLIVLPDKSKDAFQEIVDELTRKGSKAVSSKSVTLNDLRERSVLILGADSPVTGTFFGPVTGKGDFFVAVRSNPWNPDKVAAVMESRSAQETQAAFPKVPHYGTYSYLSFERGVVVDKKMSEGARGIAETLSKETAAVEILELKTLPVVMDRIADKRIIYVGEKHDLFAHHLAQLEVIRVLHGRGRKVAIGMEMFERSYQPVLDSYIAAEIDEKTFLKKTEYFKRWSYDYNLYRPILLFARVNRIPVIALNQKKEIVAKVFRSGLESLSEDERALVPREMDFSDNAYKDRLRSIFHAHDAADKDNFNRFIQAQIVWDETMAHSIAEFLTAHPDHQVVALTGAGHVEFGSGIPARAARRTALARNDYAILLSNINPEPHIADFVLYPESVQEESSPKLMVVLSDDSGRVAVSDFPPKSVSEMAGMQKGDVLRTIDSTPINSIDDLKIELLERRKGQKVTVAVLRRTFWGNRERRLEIILQ
jgi:aminopeptidase N